MATVEIIPPSDHDQSAVTAFEESGDAENDSHFSPSGRSLTTMNASITGTQANGLGMVIVGGYKEGEEFGIFVKSIRPNGPVAQDGHIRVGDQLLSVNGTSLRGVSNDQAVLLLKAGAKTDHVHLEIARDASTRSDFKRLSQVMHFNPGETPPEIRDLVRHTVIPTTDSNMPHSTSSSDLGSVSSRMSQSDDEGNFRSSSTPAMLSDEISEALRRKGHPLSSSLDFLQFEGYSPSQKQDLSAKEIELSMMASPTKGDWKDSAQNERDQSPRASQPKAAAPPPPTSPPPELDQEPSPPTEPPPAVPEGDSDRPPSSLSLDNAAPPPEPSSAPPSEPSSALPPEPSSPPPPEPSSAPPPDDNSDELAPPLPSSLPPTRSESFPTGTERPLREHTFSFPKTLGIGFTNKAAASGPAVCIDRVIRGLDAYKDGNLQSGDILLSVNDESYEGMAVEEAQKQLTMLKTRHQLREYTVKVAREGQEDEEEVQEEEEVPAVVEPGQKLESSPPPLQLPASESQESVESSPSLHKGSRTRLTKEASLPSRTSSQSSIHEKLQIPSEKSSRVSSTVSLTMANEGTPDNKQVGKVEQDGLSQATVELPKVYTEKEKLVRSTALEEQALGRKSEEQSIFVAATLPASASAEPKRDSTGSKKDRVSIDPSTPLKETPTRARKERDSSIHARLSLDPNTRVKLSKLEMGLRYTGYNLAPKQQQEMRDRLDIDDEGRVVFAEFIDVARDMFAFSLDERMFEPGSLFSLALSPKESIEPPIFSKRGYSMISNSDSSQSSHGGYEPSPEGQQKSIETKRQQLYKEGALRRTEVSPARLVSALSGEDTEESSARQQVAKQQDEITRLKSKLLEKERQCRDLELQVHSSLRDVTASSGDLEALRKRLALSEAACKAGRSKEAQLNENVQRLENKLAATRQQLVEQTPSELRKKLAILDCQLKKEQQRSKRYQVAVELLLEFGEKAHEALTATLDTGSQPIVFHPRGKGESVRRGDSVTGNPRPPQYLAQHSKKTALTLAQDAKEAVQAARKVLSKEDLPFGWEESHTEDGQKYYVNHQTQSTTWAHPPSSSKSGSRASTPSTKPERVQV